MLKSIIHDANTCGDYLWTVSAVALLASSMGWRLSRLFRWLRPRRCLYYNNKKGRNEAMQEIGAKGNRKKSTDRRIRSYARFPKRGTIHDAEIVLHTKRACSWLRDEMCRGRFITFDLHKTLCAYCLVATPGAVDVGRIVLER